MSCKINIGGGRKRYPGFLNLDIDPQTNPDHVLNLETDVLPFKNSCVSEVKAFHILEHLGPGYFHALQELYRVCEHGALIDIQVPHPLHEIYINDPTHQRPITVEGLRLFSKKQNEQEIARGGTSSCLALRFGVDFEVAAFRYIIDPFYDEIIATNTEAQNIRLHREVVNFCLEIHVKLVVIKE